MGGRKGAGQAESVGQACGPGGHARAQAWRPCCGRRPAVCADPPPACCFLLPRTQAEVDYLMKDGLSQDDMLLRAASEEAAHELPYFAGTHVYPLYPGAAAK